MNEQHADYMAAQARYTAMRDAKRMLLDAGMTDAYQVLVPAENEAWDAYLAAGTRDA